MPRQAHDVPARGQGMGADNIQLGNEWQTRYDAAHRKLDNAIELAQHQRLIDRCDPAALPSAHILTRPQIARQARRVCLLAGSFNPLTQAHVALAEAARGASQIDAIIWVYTAITIDKERVVRASLPDRIGQLSAYAEHFTRAENNIVALLNRGLYVDQASAIRPLLGTGAELYILVGFDKIVQIFDPHYYTDRELALHSLFAQAKLLVAPRAGAGEAELAALLARHENAPFADHVRFIQVPPEYAEESSSGARILASRNKDASSEALRQLVTPEGMALIQTGAYTPVAEAGDITSSDVNDVSNAYLWRQRWIQALARAPVMALWHDIPSLSAMLTCTVAHDERGAEIRRALIRALATSPKHVSRLLRATVARMR